MLDEQLWCLTSTPPRADGVDRKNATPTASHKDLWVVALYEEKVEKYPRWPLFG